MLRKIQTSPEAAGTLVARRPQFSKRLSANIWCTISPNANKLHPVTKGNRSCKLAYGSLPHQVQYDYCMRVLQQCYVPFLSDEATLVGCWELNKAASGGNVHFHFIINDPQIRNNVQLQIFQRHNRCCEMTFQNLSNPKAIDRLNSIVRLDANRFEEKCTYMDKDYYENPDFPNFYMDPVPEDGMIHDFIKKSKTVFGKNKQTVICIKDPDPVDSDVDSEISQI